MKKLLFSLTMLSFLFFNHTTSFAMQEIMPYARNKKKNIEAINNYLPELYKSTLKKAKANKYDDQDNLKVPIGLLEIVRMAKTIYLLNEDDIAQYALKQPSAESMNLFIFIAMQRIKKYNNLLNDRNKICPTAIISEKDYDIFASFRLYRKAQSLGNNCGFFITADDRDNAFLRNLTIDNYHSFEEFSELVHDLFYLKTNNLLWISLANILIGKDKNTTSDKKKEIIIQKKDSSSQKDSSSEESNSSKKYFFSLNSIKNGMPHSTLHHQIY